jgi:hypothetical protein
MSCGSRANQAKPEAPTSCSEQRSFTTAVFWVMMARVRYAGRKILTDFRAGAKALTTLAAFSRVSRIALWCAKLQRAKPFAVRPHHP